MRGPLSTPVEPVSKRVRATLVNALIEVGCPAGVAGAIVDEYAEFEPRAPGGPTLWLGDQGRGVVPGDLPDDVLQETCRELAGALSETNTEMVDRSSRGEPVSVFWPLPGREPRRFSKRHADLSSRKKAGTC